MGLFDKKFCDVCGEKIGLLGNRKLEDGNLCKDCAKKLSPWFDDRRHSTVEEIKNQLQMREENRSRLGAFHPGKVIRSDRYHLYIDEMQQMFAVSTNLDKEDNPDLLSFSMVTGCNLNMDEERREIYRTNADREEESYNPPQYEYSYDYYLYIYLNHPYIDEMKLHLNAAEISAEDYNRRQDVERAGQEMISYLHSMTGCTIGGMGMNQGMNPAMGMNQGMNPAMGMNQGMNPAMGMNQGMNPAMGMNQGMNPAMGMNQGMNPAMGMNQGMNPAMGMNQGMNPAMGMNQGMNPAMGMNQGMNPAMGMNQGMNPVMGMNQGMAQNMNMQGTMAAAGAAGAGFAGNAAAEDSWVCQSCGATNTGSFCECCGSPRK